MRFRPCEWLPLRTGGTALKLILKTKIMDLEWEIKGSKKIEWIPYSHDNAIKYKGRLCLLLLKNGVIDAGIFKPWMIDDNIQDYCFIKIDSDVEIFGYEDVISFAVLPIGRFEKN